MTSSHVFPIPFFSYHLLWFIPAILRVFILISPHIPPFSFPPFIYVSIWWQWTMSTIQHITTFWSAHLLMVFLYFDCFVVISSVTWPFSKHWISIPKIKHSSQVGTYFAIALAKNFLHANSFVLYCHYSCYPILSDYSWVIDYIYCLF